MPTRRPLAEESTVTSQAQRHRPSLDADHRILRRSPAAQRQDRTVRRPNWCAPTNAPSGCRSCSSGCARSGSARSGHRRASAWRRCCRVHDAAIHRVLEQRVGRLGRRRQSRRGDSGLLAGAAHDAASARRDLRQARLLRDGRRNLDQRRHVGGARARRRRGIDGGRSSSPGCACGVRAVPPSRPSCGAGPVRRLLLFEQRRHRRPISCATRAPRGSRSSMSTSITATEPRTSSSIGPTCCMRPCTAIRPRRFPTFPATPTRRVPAPGRATT